MHSTQEGSCARYKILTAQVLGGIGHGAAKVAGGAIKMVGKGIWAVGKAATR